MSSWPKLRGCRRSTLQSKSLATKTSSTPMISRSRARAMRLSDRIELALALVSTAPVLAYDIETTGLDADARVCGYAVSDETTAVYVPVRHASGNVDAPER